MKSNKSFNNEYTPGKHPGEENYPLVENLLNTKQKNSLTKNGIKNVKKALNADGADTSGLKALTFPVMFNYAVDAILMVALSNTLFFSAAKAESKEKVMLYLLINIAPFAVIAPFIGPLLDKLQRGRRIALASSFVFRAILCFILVKNSSFEGDNINYSSYYLYPCALGMMIFSKSFSVLKAAVTPRVIPHQLDLVRTNARLTTFGLIGGTIGGVLGGVFEYGGKLLHIPGALYLIIIVSIFATVFCLKIPKWVEITKGENQTVLIGINGNTKKIKLNNVVTSSLFSTTTIRFITGFLTLYTAFVAKAENNISGFQMLIIAGSIGAAGGLGNFAGNILSSRLKFNFPDKTALTCAVVSVTLVILGSILHNMWFMVVIAGGASIASAIAKASLDSSIQSELPENYRASAFGRSESFLQLGWVSGAAGGVLLSTDLMIGFGIISLGSILILFFALKPYFLTHFERKTPEKENFEK